MTLCGTRHLLFEAEKVLYSQLRREELEEKKKLALQKDSSESVNALRLNQRRLQDLIEDCPLCGTRMLRSLIHTPCHDMPM